MISEIELLDFMSHQRTVIRPAAGLTALVGPNNCGKSAVVAALRTVCGNSTKSHMVRHGCKGCSVTLRTDDGHVVTWRRKGTVVSYTIDGVDVHRVGGGLPDGLHDLLKLAAVELEEGKESFDVHFATQKEPIFLLNDSGRKAAAFFASSSDAAGVVAMQKRHKEKVTNWKRDVVQLARETAELERQLAALAGVAGLEEQVERAAETAAAMRAGTERVEKLARAMETLAGQAVAADRGAARVAALAGLKAPPELASTRELERLLREMAASEMAAAQSASAGAILHPLAAPPELSPTAPLEKCCAALEAEEKRRRMCEARAAAVAGLRTPPELATVDTLAHTIAALDAETARVAAHQRELGLADEHIADMQQEIRRWMVDHPTCPACGGPLDAAALLEAHGHAA